MGSYGGQGNNGETMVVRLRLISKPSLRSCLQLLIAI